MLQVRRVLSEGRLPLPPLRDPDRRLFKRRGNRNRDSKEGRDIRSLRH